MQIEADVRYKSVFSREMLNGQPVTEMTIRRVFSWGQDAKQRRITLRRRHAFRKEMIKMAEYFTVFCLHFFWFSVFVVVVFVLLFIDVYSISVSIFSFFKNILSFIFTSRDFSPIFFSIFLCLVLLFYSLFSSLLFSLPPSSFLFLNFFPSHFSYAFIPLFCFLFSFFVLHLSPFPSFASGSTFLSSIASTLFLL